MRFDARVAYGLMSVALVGFSGVMADDIDDILGDSAASPASAAESSSTPIAISKPSFTVSRSDITVCLMANFYSRSLSLLKRPSLSSSQKAGTPGGRSLTRRRKMTRLVMRSGHTSGNGLLRSQPF